MLETAPIISIAMPDAQVMRATSPTRWPEPNPSIEKSVNRSFLDKESSSQSPCFRALPR
jgi:hypothetical protein